MPANLVAAEQLVDALDATAQPNPNNAYTTATRVVWGTPGQPRTYRAFTECASLTTATLMHSYPGWANPSYFAHYFGAASPLARDYEERISSGAVPHFTSVSGPVYLQPATSWP